MKNYSFTIVLCMAALSVVSIHCMEKGRGAKDALPKGSDTSSTSSTGDTKSSLIKHLRSKKASYGAAAFLGVVASSVVDSVVGPNQYLKAGGMAFSAVFSWFCNRKSSALDKQDKGASCWYYGYKAGEFFSNACFVACGASALKNTPIGHQAIDTMNVLTDQAIQKLPYGSLITSKMPNNTMPAALLTSSAVLGGYYMDKRAPNNKTNKVK